MQLDIIEIRTYNYFEHNRQVKQINKHDLANISVLLPELKPIKIAHVRLSRLNFVSVSNSEIRFLQKFSNKIYFNFYTVKSDKLLLVINDEIKLPHIVHVHQLQNLYYDLTGDILKLPEAKNEP